ncbi:hypothetical protein [Chelativorans sp. M5D2P16]|uniref:hypothetical protein n=1 Tax=Chelativorans sp. M5D2P16 TaxID=3095678 RepID=UPI002ACA3557|nr:hypothetical protein [Chelativorans sp. M5D2P16]MDZ5697640.1 hypothetical protein [Chelativorans sp. M5D2P16]
MPKATIVVREVGSLKPDYSLDFDLPALPKPGDYISIHRPDKREPYGEDMIVRQVWWRLEHPETAPYGSDQPKTGALNEISVECDPAIGPHSSDSWRDSLERARQRGQVQEFEIARLSIREDELKD